MFPPFTILGKRTVLENPCELPIVLFLTLIFTSSRDRDSCRGAIHTQAIHTLHPGIGTVVGVLFTHFIPGSGQLWGCYSHTGYSHTSSWDRDSCGGAIHTQAIHTLHPGIGTVVGVLFTHRLYTYFIPGSGQLWGCCSHTGYSHTSSRDRDSCGGAIHTLHPGIGTVVGVLFTYRLFTHFIPGSGTVVGVLFIHRPRQRCLASAVCSRVGRSHFVHSCMFSQFFLRRPRLLLPSRLSSLALQGVFSCPPGCLLLPSRVSSIALQGVFYCPPGCLPLPPGSLQDGFLQWCCVE